MRQIKVLQHHIDQGMRANAFWCPIAQAIREQFGVMQVAVGPTIYVDNVKWGAAPVEAVNFMSRFDRNMSVEPFVFEMDMVQ